MALHILLIESRGGTDAMEKLRGRFVARACETTRSGTGGLEQPNKKLRGLSRLSLTSKQSRRLNETPKLKKRSGTYWPLLSSISKTKAASFNKQVPDHR